MPLQGDPEVLKPLEEEGFRTGVECEFGGEVAADAVDVVLSPFGGQGFGVRGL